jgi:hypothetical protein
MQKETCLQLTDIFERFVLGRQSFQRILDNCRLPQGDLSVSKWCPLLQDRFHRLDHRTTSRIEVRPCISARRSLPVRTRPRALCSARTRVLAALAGHDVRKVVHDPAEAPNRMWCNPV